MRILIAHSRYRSASPSGENLVVENEAALLRSAGHRVLVYERRSDDVAGWSRPHQATLAVTSIRNPGVRREFTHLLMRFRPDVVHVHNTFPMLSPSVLEASTEADVPVVVTIHNYQLLCCGSFYRADGICHDCADGSVHSALAHGCYHESRTATVPVVAGMLLNRQIWREHVTAYVYVSAAQRDLMSALALPPERTFVKHNFVSPVGRPANGPREGVAFLGRLSPVKGLGVLMRAWDAVLARGVLERPRLVLVGSGPQEQELRDWAAGRPSVTMTGKLAPAAARAVLDSSNAVVVPSEWEETFGLVAVEGMAAGVAPIVPAHGAFPELVTDGVDGVHFAPGDVAGLADALLAAHQDPDHFRTLGRHAHETYERRFRPEQSLARLEEIYRFAILNPLRGPVGQGDLVS